MSGLTANTVVVPIDFSEASVAAIDTALEITGSASKVHVVHVLPQINIADPGVIWDTIDNDSRLEHAKQVVRDQLTDAKYKDLVIGIEIGDAGDRIAGYAEEQNADLIVTPSHGRRGLSRMLIGSVAERVIRLAPCPVLVLRR